jgi:hypothetical protein
MTQVSMPGPRHFAHRSKVEAFDPAARGMRYGSLMAMGGFIAALWLFDFAMHAWWRV